MRRLGLALAVAAAPSIAWAHSGLGKPALLLKKLLPFSDSLRAK